MRDRNERTFFAKIAWTTAKAVGMLFVALVCFKNLQAMSTVAALTGARKYVVYALLADAFFLFWAYRVIWTPADGG